MLVPMAVCVEILLPVTQDVLVSDTPEETFRFLSIKALEHTKDNDGKPDDKHSFQDISDCVCKWRYPL